ncbi:MAG: EutN/CcmL family microcompartment protein [Spirochaetota bacterium]
MTLGRVVGTVVATTRGDTLAEPRFLLVEPCDEAGSVVGDAVVALDLVGAGPGEVVIFAKGSSCRWTHETDDEPVDVLIMGIIDSIDRGGGLTYKKE